MDLSPLSLLVFLFGLSLPLLVLVYAAIDTARWQRQEAELKESETQPPVYFS